MKDYVILTDAAADPADQIAKEYPFVKIIPMSVSIAGREYIWGGETGTLTCEEFYSLLRSGYFGSTSSISPGIYAFLESPTSVASSVLPAAES